MTGDQAEALRALLQGQEVAALGTLHQGEPFVSMVPYALRPDTGAFIVHVSRLATHTRDMEQHAGVSLLVTGERAAQVPPQALPRATLQGQAQRCAADGPEYAAARRCYLARFPQSEDMFGFADFSLFVILPRAVRFVGGFAQAWSATGENYAAAMAQGGPGRP
jgi:putative heme iron utilization protein